MCVWLYLVVAWLAAGVEGQMPAASPVWAAPPAFATLGTWTSLADATVLQWGAGDRTARATWNADGCVSAGVPPPNVSLGGSKYLDANGYDQLGVWIHADAAVSGAAVVLLLNSDNCSSAGPDYYYTPTLLVDWEGWKWVTWRLDTWPLPIACPTPPCGILLPAASATPFLLQQRTPVGTNAISGLQVVAKYDADQPDTGTLAIGGVAFYSTGLTLPLGLTKGVTGKGAL